MCRRDRAYWAQRRSFVLLVLSFAIALQAAPVALGRRTTASLPDTVEIYAFKVEFAFEDPDNSLTTGRGVFDSDSDTSSANYSLDPQGARRTNSYWQKQLEFVSHWYRTVSRGKVVIRPKIFPEAGGSYRLDEQMIDYNRTTRRNDEKVAQFDSSKVVDYLRFARDAIRAAATSDDSPFKEPLPTGGRTHRLFMAIHAGANRLLDGGSMGTRYADTPGDFTDMMIDRDDFKWLRDIDSAQGDTLGIVLKKMGVDTVSSLMVVSETASQDGLNWGVQGSMVHQVARAVGLPIAYDAVKGISRTGWFDMLDFAGYSSANGFLPVYPNPWARAYMGWDEVVEARVGKDGSTATYNLKAVADTTPGGIRILKVPLNSGEYLLIENRQKSADPSGKVTIKTDQIERTLHADSLDQIFLDSLCDGYGRNCKVNSKKGRGVMHSASSYDAGLPSSGIAVWKVSDWYLDRVLRYGYLNATQEGGLSDNYLGVQLLEADGVLTIGREFRDAYGQSFFDYGSGTDLLPHISYSKGKRDTVQSITPYSYASTQSSNHGLTHLSLSVALPTSGRKERSIAPFSGDSVINFAAPELEVTVDWRGLALPNSQFPRRVAPTSRPENIALLPLSPRSNKQLLAVMGDDGHLQLYDEQGAPAVEIGDSILYRAGYDSVAMQLDDPSLTKEAWLPLPTLGKPAGAGMAMTTWEQQIVSLHQKGEMRQLRFTSLVEPPLSANDSAWRSTTIGTKATIGPIVWEGSLWAASSDSLWRWEQPGAPAERWGWPVGFHPHAIAGVAHRSRRGEAGVVAIGDSAQVLFLPIGGVLQTVAKPLAKSSDRGRYNEVWRIAVSDFLRSGSEQLFAVGSHGTLLMVDLASGELAAPLRTVARGRSGATAALSRPFYHDSTAVAVADLDGDGYPELIFTGHNALYAVDRHGVTLEGFPFRYRGDLLEGHLLEPPFIPGSIHSSPLLVDVTGDGKPEILSATPAGLLYAVDHKGELVLSSIGASPTPPSAGAMRRTADWPLAVGSLSFGDTLRTPWIRLAALNRSSQEGLQLYALSYDHLFGWRIPKSKPTSNSWLAEGGGSGRASWFDAAALDGRSARAEATIIRFHLYPSPLKTARGNFLIELGADAQSARIRLLDVKGAVAFDQTWEGLHRGLNRIEGVNLSHLGSDLYTILLEVEFGSGEKKKKWSRAGVVR